MSIVRIHLDGFGPLELEEGERLLGVRHRGRRLLLKVASAPMGSFLARQSIVFTRQFSAMARAGEPVSPLSAERALQLEAERIHQSAGAWRHEVLWGGRVRGLGEETHGLLLPYHEGQALRELPREAWRRLLPAQLPWLWDALSAAPHGDIHEGNLIVSPSRELVLIDPGVMHFSYREHGGDSVSECTFTTNVEHYPILPPYYLPEQPLCQTDGLSGHLARLREGLSGVVQLGALSFAGGASPLLRPPAPRAEPAPADLMALGVLYGRALLGAHPLYDRDFTQPAWLGSRCFDSHRDRDTGFEAALARLSRPLPSPSGATPAEAALLRALLELRIHSREELVSLSAAASPP